MGDMMRIFSKKGMATGEIAAIIFLLSLVVLGIYAYDVDEYTKKTIAWLEVHQYEINGVKFEYHFRKRYSRRSGTRQTLYVLNKGKGLEYHLVGPFKSLMPIAKEETTGKELLEYIKKYNQEKQLGILSKTWRWFHMTDEDNFVLYTTPLDLNRNEAKEDIE